MTPKGLVFFRRRRRCTAAPFSVSGSDVRLQQSSLLAVHLACKNIGHIVRDVPCTVLVRYDAGKS